MAVTIVAAVDEIVVVVVIDVAAVDKVAAVWLIKFFTLWEINKPASCVTTVNWTSGSYLSRCFTK